MVCQFLLTSFIHKQHRNISSRPYLLSLVKKAIATKEITKPLVKFEYDAGKPVGYESVVETPPAEKVVYAQTVNDVLYSRFAIKGTPKATTYISIVLSQNEDGSYDLVDTWIGRIKPPRPGSQNETADSRTYWENHAFLLDTQQLQRQSRTTICPY